MTMRLSVSFTAALLAASLLGGCSLLGKSKPKTTPTVGDRIAVLVNETDIEIDPATAAAPMVLPEMTRNEDWGQPGGSPSKSMGHLFLAPQINLAWSASIGDGSSKSRRLGDGPVVAGGKVFTIDTNATVRAFSVANGAQIWSARFGTEKGNASSLYGGGVASDGNRVFATNGLGHVAALDARNGSIIWQVQPGGPLRGAPTIDGETIYVTSQDNQIYSLKATDGATNWSNAAALQIAGVFGAGAPAVARGTVVAGFSSGELNAYRYENGRQVWQDALSRTSISTGVADLSDIDADPVIESGFVYALGKGGRLVALDLISGQRVWELNMAGISTPWVAGDWLFAANDKAQVVAINRLNGKIRWINQLPRYRSEKKENGPIFYYGPVLAGNRLVVAGSNGAMITINPIDGAFIAQSNVGSAVRFQPAVAGGTLYLLTDTGRLLAYR